MGAPVQGALDVGEPCTDAFPVLVAGCGPTGLVAPLELDAGGNLLVTVGGSGGSVVVTDIEDGTGDSIMDPVLNAAQVSIVAGGGSSVDPVEQGALTDRSGTIAVGGTSQVLAAANAARRYLFVQNISTGDLWINFGVAAVQNQPSVQLEAFAAFVMEGTFISTDSVTIIGATTGQAFTAKEG